MKVLRIRRLDTRSGDIAPHDSDKTKSGTPRLRLGKAVLNDDRQLQTFEEALRDTIEQNRGALRKLAKR
ncbi:MAG: hypothetical protein AMXMBFR59_26370 [Rhodanobacteraceae bacterium]